MLCLSVSVLLFGVYAAKRASLTTTGNMSFNAHNCKVRVLGKIEGAVNSNNQTLTIAPLTDATNTNQGKLIEGDVTWSIAQTIYFDDLSAKKGEIATPIVFTFEMTNESDYAITAEISLTGDLAKKVVSTTVFTASDGSTVTSSGYVCILEKDQKATLTLSLTPSAAQTFSNVNLNNLKLNFERPEAKTEYENTLTFTPDSTTKTASVKAASTTITTANIPAAYRDGDNVYLVNDIPVSYYMGSYSDGFANCSSLQSVVIPSSITSIEGVFFNCSSLTSITIPDSVTSIGAAAFSGCSSLTSITIPDSVTSIGAAAFSGCTGLTSITIPSSVTSFGTNNVFTNFTGLLKATIGVTCVDMFKNNTSLNELIFLEGISSIETSAFEGCTGLTSITIPASVTSIGSRAFYGCTGLTSIVVDSKNTAYDSRNNCNAIIETVSNKLIKGCNNSTIPNGVTSIDYQAFQGCTGLTSVTVPNGVTSIESCTFSGCTSLSLVTIPVSVTTIGGVAFSSYGGSNTNLTSVTYQGTKEQWNAITKNLSMGNDWKAFTSITTVHCTDGDIDLTA